MAWANSRSDWPRLGSAFMRRFTPSRCAGSIPSCTGTLEHVLKHFFGWQALGFLVAAIVATTRRPSATGRVLGGYLALSTAALLAFSQNAAMIASLALLLLWMACTVQGMRLAIARAAGQRYATWGVATAAVYAALVPICFFLGLLDAITPPIVAALAVATALPGAVVGAAKTVADDVSFSRSVREPENSGHGAPESEFGRRLVLARSDLGDSGRRVHRRQHRRSRLRLRSRASALHAAGDRRPRAVASIRLLVSVATDGSANVQRGGCGRGLDRGGEVVLLARAGGIGFAGGRGGSTSQRVA